MPSRILNDEILACDRVDALSHGAEVFYRRLFSAVDDFGRFDGRPDMLRANLYPLRADSVTRDDVIGWVAECDSAGLVTPYVVGGKPFIVLHNAGRPRAKTSQYPDPPDSPPDSPAVPAWTTHRKARLVYFIHDAASEAVKIGSAVCPESRLRELQTSNPNELTLLGTREGGQPEEKRLHALFAFSRLRGEWFAMTEQVKGWLWSEGLVS